MDVRPADVHIVKRADAAVGGVSQRARHGERNEESDGCQEKPAPWAIMDMQVKQVTDFPVAKEQQDGGDHDYD
jgi:hypothetical protein